MDLTAIDVLNQFLEFQSLVPNTALWKESELIGNSPRLYRFNQLQALFQAFDLGQLTEFASGKFVDKRPLKDYQIIFDKAQQYFKDLEESHHDYLLNEMRNRDDVRCIIRFFKLLFLYRKKLYELLNVNRGVYAASGLFYYAFRKTEDFNQIINDNLESIDNIIVLIISPENRSFTRKQLIEQFGYPDVNLSEIDTEWL